MRDANALSRVFRGKIGIVTSRSGAVIQDIRHIFERRYPLPQVFLSNTAVQGADAPPQIVAALRALQQIPNLDVIILARRRLDGRFVGIQRRARRPRDCRLDRACRFGRRTRDRFHDCRFLRRPAGAHTNGGSPILYTRPERITRQHAALSTAFAARHERKHLGRKAAHDSRCKRPAPRIAAIADRAAPSAA